MTTQPTINRICECGRPATVHDLTMNVWRCATCTVFKIKRSRPQEGPQRPLHDSPQTAGGY